MAFIRVVCFIVLLLFCLIARICKKSNYKIMYFNYKNTITDDNSNLILSFALNYKYSNIKLFINSLKRSNYSGTVILFTYHISEELKSKLNLNKINVIELDNKYPFYPYNHKKFPISNKSIAKHLHFFNGKKFVTYRYFLYKLFFIHYGYRYKFILLTDIRDVIFQLNPFQWNIKKGVFLVEEHPTKRIKDDVFNKKFVKDYNPSSYLYNSKVINGGTIYASYPEILLFMVDLLKYICLFDCNANDQGGINSFIRSINNFHYPIYILNSSHTPIRTLTLWFLENLCCCVPINFFILNFDMSIPHIIHQYDRAIKLNITNITIHNLYLSYIRFYANIK